MSVSTVEEVFEDVPSDVGIGPLERIKRDGIPYPFICSWNYDSFEDSCDVIIVVEEEHYPAHESVISAASPVLKVMLTNGMKESVSKEVMIDSIKKAAWEIAMGFFYTGRVRIEDEEICIDILCFAHLYEIDMLLRLAENELIRYTNRENVIEKLLFAEKLGLKVLYNASMEIIGIYFLNVHETEAFQNLPFRIVDEILMRKDLYILTELDIAEAIIGWADKAATKKEGDPGVFLPWKNAQAQHLFGHMKCAAKEEIEMCVRLPGIRVYPDLLVKLLDQMSFNPKRSNCAMHRYEPTLKSRRYTFLWQFLPFNVKSGSSIEGPWHNCDKHKSKYRLEISRSQISPNTYTARIEPAPVNTDKSEIFILTKRGRDITNFHIHTIKHGFKVDIPAEVQGDMVVFGANIFH